MALNAKPVARFLYANVPGLASARFAVKDFVASYVTKAEYRALTLFPLHKRLIIDVGANRGQSIAAFKKFAPTSEVVAFEPAPRLAGRITALYRSDPTVRIHQNALGAQTGVATLYIPHYGWWDCDGMAATELHCATEWLNDPGRMYRYDARKLSVQSVEIDCQTLDSFRLAPHLLKLHAQGAELDILRGALKTLRRHRPAVMSAFPSADFTDFIAELGYQPYIYADGDFRAGVAKPPVTFTWYLTNEHFAQMTPPRPVLFN